MKVLIAGGAGFIGSHTVDLLLEKGYQVRILDSLAPPVHANGHVPDYVPLDDVEFIRGDVRDWIAWEQALEGVDAVIHLAYQDYLPDFSKLFHVNGVGTARLYELIVEKHLPVQKVVVASSQATYGEAKYLRSDGSVIYPQLRPESQLKRGVWDPLDPDAGEPLTPTWTDEAVVNPHDQYAMSKYTQEMVALNLGKRYGIPTVCLRYTYVQGPRNSFYNAYSGIARIFALRLLHGLPPVCFENGQQLRDCINVKDVARAKVLVIEDERADCGVFNVGGKRPVTVLEFAYIMANEFDNSVEPLVPGEFRLGDTRHTVSDVSRLEALGWQPTIPVEQNVCEYVAWMREQQTTDEFLHEAEQMMREEGVVRKVEK